jgi:hypothetical protein
MIIRALAATTLVLSVPAAAAGELCAMSAPERAWLDTSLEAWRYMDARLKLAPDPRPTVVVFDTKCRFESAAGGKPWQAEAHSGRIRLPDGEELPVQVTSFAGQNGKTAERFFVMALPSIWDAAGIPISGDHLGLTGVFLHEFSHTRHTRALKPVFEAAEALRPMTEDFNDDSLQEHFQSDPAYVATFEKELDLLYRAAGDPTASKSKALAREALAMMEARQRRWFVGEAAYWKSYDDLFLTMEGFGQWVAYSWLADPKGGGLTPAAAQEKMRGRRKWWSQEEGLALFLVIDRFVPNWAAQTFASRPALGIDLLRRAVDEPS